MFMGVGVLVVLPCWGLFAYMSAREEYLPVAIIAAVVLIPFVLLVAWIPQALVVFAAVIYAQERHRNRELSQETGNQARSQSELPK
jgi:hypothetical protein